jgi:hypothetical protein
MNFRLYDFVETDKFQFLRIHKNGNTSVNKCILDTYGKEVRYTHQLSKKVRFCVIRDPYERFLSGLKWDMWINKIDIKDIDISKLFTTNEHHVRNIWSKQLSHTVSQIPYLFNAQCSHYIDISDLTIFLKMHFKKSEHRLKLEDLKKDVSLQIDFLGEKFSKLTQSIPDNTKDIEKYIDKDEIMKYLHLDYFVYNHLKQSPFLWEWQHGRIF